MTVTVTEAKKNLDELIKMVERGDEVIITRHGQPVARLLRFQNARQPRVPGALKGKLWIADDSDAPDPEIDKMFADSVISHP